MALVDLIRGKGKAAVGGLAGVLQAANSANPMAQDTYGQPIPPAPKWVNFLMNSGNAIANAVMAPSNALAGKYDQIVVGPDGKVLSMMDPRMMDDAATLSGLLTTGALPIPKPVGSLGIFGGKMAATADKAALAKAEKMAAAGASRDEIWNATGWFKGVDGQWRFEIDDSSAKFRAPYVRAFETTNPGEVIAKNNMSIMSHPGLHQAYDDLWKADLEIRKSDPNIGVGGRFEKQESGKENVFLAVQNLDQARQFNLHELQHAVQQRENFAQGGGPDQFTQQAEAEMARTAMSWRRELAAKRKTMPNASDAELEAAVIADYNEMGAPDWVPPKDVRDVAKDVSNNPDDQLQEIIRVYQLDKYMSVPSPMEMYKRLAGEVESRNVEARMNMTPEQRRAKAPWLTQDVPDDLQIVRMRALAGL